MGRPRVPMQAVLGQSELKQLDITYVYRVAGMGLGNECNIDSQLSGVNHCVVQCNSTTKDT